MLYYITHAHLPTKKAFGYAIAKMCSSFAETGEKVVLVMPSSRGKSDIFSYYSIPVNFTVHEVSALDLGRLKFLGEKIPFLIKRISFGIAVFFAVKPEKGDIFYSRDLLSLPLLRMKTGNIFLELHYLSKLDAILTRFVRVAKKIIVVTRHLKEELTALGYSATDILVEPSGFDPEDFKLAGISRADLRRGLGLPEKVPIVLYLGNLFPWKGVYTLVDAFAAISRRGGNDAASKAVLVCVGGSEDTLASFRGYAAQMIPARRLMILGHKRHAETAQYQIAADVLVLPNSAKERISMYNTSPIKLFEYMASGTPIVASDLPSLREILDEKMCVFAKPDDAESLATAIIRVLDHPEEARAGAERAREKVSLYSWGKRTKDILDFIKKNDAIFMEDGMTRVHKTKDRDFYDKESSKYSDKRYPKTDTDYTHFFFKRRLSIALSILEKVISSRPKIHSSGRPALPSLLEVGCADGVVLRAAYDRFGHAVSSYEGIDISPGMIEVARKKQAGTPLNFSVREPRGPFVVESKDVKKDIIIEIGVLNYADFDGDIKLARETISDDGYYICSVAGRGSLDDRFRKSDHGFDNFMAYGEYESRLRQSFDIVSVYPVGLRIPVIWRSPMMARAIQPVVETVMAPIARGLFHEKVYVLKKGI
jgi:glycosyltransferase involved in cell wall biosynthesis/SAM-dependent methyltransferase